MRIRRPLLGLFFLASIGDHTSLGQQTPQEFLKRSTYAGHAGATLEMKSMLFAFQLQNEQELEQLLEDQQNPNSPLYHQWITPEEFGKRFGVSEEKFQRVVNWLQQNGFSIAHQYPNRLSIYFDGTAAQVERAFQVGMGIYEQGGRQYYSNDRLAQVPLEFQDVTLDVLNLDNFPKEEPVFKSGNTISMGAADMAIAYNLNPLFSSGISGTGQTVAIVARTDFTMNDVRLFRSTFGLPVNDPQKVFVTSNPGNLGGNEEIEVLMDAEWSGAMAPNATIKVVIAANKNISASIDYIINNLPTAHVISISFGLGESAVNASTETAQNNKFSQAAAQGQTVFVSSGDNGAQQSTRGSSLSSGQDINYLCASPNVVCVGGTSLNRNFDSSGNFISYAGETAWSGSGGGKSIFISKPSFQFGPGVPSDGWRDVPDVAALAYSPYAFLYQGGSLTCCYYGTSLAAPLWAGIFGLVNQAGSGSGMGAANTRIYEMARNQLSGGTTVFNDVTSGNNSTSTVLGFSAGVGYDQVTGWGSFNADPFVRGFSTPPGTPTSPSPAGGATGVSLTPTLSWTGGSGASSHDVYFGTSSPPPFVTNTTGTSYNPGTLSAGTTYYWQVVAKNNAGSTSSSTWSFTTLARPGVPSNPLPSNGATGVSLTPTLSWTGGSGATSHDVYFGTSSSPPFVTNTTGTSYNPGTLSAGTTYYWRVVAKNNAGSTSSSAWSFTTLALPGVPSNPSPSNGATGISLTPTLSWTGGSGASSHDVYFGTSSSPPFVANTTGTSYNPGTLSAGTTYYWQVVAKNNAGSTSSSTWSFTTLALPGVPSNPSPSNGATGISLTPTLSWTGGSGASSHDVYFGTSSSPPFVANTTATSYTPASLAINTTYYWKLVAKNSAGGTSSSVWSFTTLTTYTISGQVTLSGRGLSPVTVYLTGTQTSSKRTDLSGNYTFNGLTVGGNFTVTPSQSGYSFSPPSSTFNPLSSNQTANFAAQQISLGADPTTVNPGGVVKVTVTNGPGNPTDWVGLYAVGAAQSRYLDRQYLNGLKTATLNFTMPTTPGDYIFRFFASDSYNLLATSPKVTVTNVTSPLSITAPSPLPEGIVGSPYATTIAATGGMPRYIWSSVSGSLPQGLGLNSNTGVISGVPTTAVTGATFTIQVTDGSTPALTARQQFELTVEAGANTQPTLGVDKTTVNPGDTVNVSVNNGPGNQKDWVGLYETSAAQSRYLNRQYLNGPRTATLNFTMPTAPGAYNFRFFSNDSYNLLATSPTVTVLSVTSPLTITTASPLPNGKVGNAYVTAIVVTGGTPRYGWSVVSGSLPQGLDLNLNTGAITGTPTSAVQASFTVQVSDSGSPAQTARGNFALQVDPAAAAVPALGVDKTTVIPGDTVNVTVTNGPGNPTDWVGLYATTASNTRYVEKQYLGGVTSATLSFTMPSTLGTYNFRFFASDGYTLLATSPTVTVRAP